MGHSRPVAIVGSRVLPPVDRFVNRMTGGRTRLSDLLFPTLMLTTTGCKSGRPRETPLLYVRDGESYVVCASNFGQDRHPAWSTNLIVNPEAMVETQGGRFGVKAHLASDDDKRALWPSLTAVWPAFDDYAGRAVDRDIRVFFLDPVEP